MAIANAVQRGTSIYVYNEKNNQIFTVSVGTGPKDGLHGFTSSTLSVRIGTSIYTYNESGNRIASTSVG